MRGPSGYATITDPDHPLVERDTVTCAHCQRIVFVKPATAATVYLILDPQTRIWTEQPGAFCRSCMRPVCLPCEAAGRCVPWERAFEAMEAKDRLVRQVIGG